MQKQIIVTILVIAFLAIGFYYLAFGISSHQSISDNSSAGLSSGENKPNQNVQNMKIETLQEGAGEPAKAGDTVTVNYVGTLENGTKFDSSIDRGQPFEFTLGQNSVIQGWEQGVVGMKVGEKRRLTIPPGLAYGENGAGDIIPPNATLIFEIDMLGIK